MIVREADRIEIREQMKMNFQKTFCQLGMESQLIDRF